MKVELGEIKNEMEREFIQEFAQILAIDIPYQTSMSFIDFKSLANAKITRLAAKPEMYQQQIPSSAAHSPKTY